MTTKARITDRYNEANLECACIIAGNPTLYPEGSLMAEWADTITSRAANAEEAKAMPLFKAVA